MATLDVKSASLFHRLLLITIVGQIAAELALDRATLIILVVSALAYAIFSFNLARAIGATPWVWTIVAFVPLLNFLAALLLLNKTNGVFKANGIKVGFFGGVKAPMEPTTPAGPVT